MSSLTDIVIKSDISEIDSIFDKFSNDTLYDLEKTINNKKKIKGK